MEEGLPAIIVSPAGPFSFSGWGVVRGWTCTVRMRRVNACGRLPWRGDADVADPAGTFNKSWGPYAGLSASDAGVLTVQVPSLRGGGVV